MIWVYLTSGRGPAECEIAVAKLAVILRIDATGAGLDSTLIDPHYTTHGLSSVMIALEGNGAATFAATWNGSIQWICPSPLRGKRSRRNWFISGSVIQPPSADAKLAARDLHFDNYRASGPGGQHVNKTNSAVRVTHLPTGLTAQAQEERSQLRNKTLAVARLAALLDARTAAGVQQSEQEKWQAHDDLVRGNPIRTYRGPDFQQV